MVMHLQGALISSLWSPATGPQQTGDVIFLHGMALQHAHIILSYACTFWGDTSTSSLARKVIDKDLGLEKPNKPAKGKKTPTGGKGPKGQKGPGGQKPSKGKKGEPLKKAKVPRKSKPTKAATETTAEPAESAGPSRKMRRKAAK